MSVFAEKQDGVKSRRGVRASTAEAPYITVVLMYSTKRDSNKPWPALSEEENTEEK